MAARIRSLHIYPVKSCAGIDLSESPIDRAGLNHDRRWLIVTAEGQFMTQRQWPRMALIRTALDARWLTLSAPGQSPLQVALDESGLAPASEQVEVWRDAITARADTDAAAAWLSEFLGTPCRLLKVDREARRPAKPEWVDGWLERHPDFADEFAGDHFFGFADGFPLLITNQASLDDLNARLEARGAAAVPMDRFRPNIVIESDDWPAFEEDQTAVVTLGEVRLALVKPCTRCSVPDIDQRTAQTYAEPGQTLAGYRNLDIGVVFGQNAIVSAPQGAVLRVGDAVEIELDF